MNFLGYFNRYVAFIWHAKERNLIMAHLQQKKTFHKTVSNVNLKDAWVVL